MKRYVWFLLVVFIASAFSPPDSINGWPVFARVKFNSTYFKELNEYFLVPAFDKRITSMVGSEITVKGYYIPFDLPKNQLIISKNPYSACFFCGGAGPESVAEVLLKTKAPKLKVDQIITIKGKLKLNDMDVSHLNFILEEAEIII